MAGHAEQDAIDDDQTALVRLLYLSAVVHPSKPGEQLLNGWMETNGLKARATVSSAEREAEWLARSRYWFMADGAPPATGSPGDPDGPAPTETEAASDG